MPTNTELAILGLVAERPKHGYQIEQDIEARGYRGWTEIGFSSIYYVLNKLEGAGWLASQIQAGDEEPDRPSLPMPPGHSAQPGQPDQAPQPNLSPASYSAQGQAPSSAGDLPIHPTQSGSTAPAEGRPINRPSARTARSGGPARKVYRLTPAGMEAYREAVRERLSHPRPRTGDLDLALANLPALTPAEARAALAHYRDTLRASIDHTQAKWQSDRAQAAGHLPPHVDTLFDHALALMRAELNWLDQYLTPHQEDRP